MISRLQEKLTALRKLKGLEEHAEDLRESLKSIYTANHISAALQGQMAEFVSRHGCRLWICWFQRSSSEVT